MDVCVVRETFPGNTTPVTGRGISIQACDGGQGCATPVPATASVTRSLVQQHFEVGVFVTTAEPTMERSVVRHTSPRPDDQLFGAGVAVISGDGPATLTLAKNLIDDSAHAGVASFGALVTLDATHIRCAAFHFTGDPFDGQQFIFEDRGDNRCGCPNADGPCKATGAGVAPPEALAPSQ
jgi:hypothetical protein